MLYPAEQDFFKLISHCKDQSEKCLWCEYAGLSAIELMGKIQVCVTLKVYVFLYKDCKTVSATTQNA